MSLVYSAPRIPGATRSNCLYLGGKAEAKDEKLLRKLGITHILNVTPEKEVNVKNKHKLSATRHFPYFIPKHDLFSLDSVNTFN